MVSSARGSGVFGGEDRSIGLERVPPKTPDPFLPGMEAPYSAFRTPYSALPRRGQLFVHRLNGFGVDLHEALSRSGQQGELRQLIDFARRAARKLEQSASTVGRERRLNTASAGQAFLQIVAGLNFVPGMQIDPQTG